MNIEESIQQIETLIEAWQLDEADLNQTDINAMQVLLKENQELKKQLEERTKMYQNAYNYSQKMETKAIILETQQKEFIKYLEDEMNKCQSNIFADGVKYGFQLSLSKYKKIIGVLDENNIK